VRVLLDDLTSRKKPIGAISLGRTVLSAYLGEPMSDDDLAMPATEVAVDGSRHMLFTPGFLTATRVSEVEKGVDTMVASILRMALAGLPVLR